MKAGAPELGGKQSRIGLSHAADREQAELVKTIWVLGPTPHRRDTGSGASQAFAPSGETTVKPSGLRKALATFATYLVDDKPTDAVRPPVTSWIAIFRRCPIDLGRAEDFFGAGHIEKCFVEA